MARSAAISPSRPKRRGRRFALLTFAFVGALTAVVDRPEAHAQDWDVKRNPFDPKIIARYKSILKRNPHDAGALSKLMNLYRRYRSVEKLTSEYEKGEPNRPNLVVLAHIYVARGETDRAISFFEAARDDSDAVLEMALGKLYRQKGELTNAQTAFAKALQARLNRSQRSEILRNLADISLAEGKLEKSRQYFSQLIELSPKDIALRLELGDALAAHKKWQDSLEEYRKAEKMVRGDPAGKVEVITRIGQALEGSGDTKAAITEYNRAIDVVGRNYFAARELILRIVDIHRRERRLEALLTTFESAWKPASRNHFEWDTLARLYEETGNTNKAIDAYRKASQKSRYELDTHRRLITLLENAGRENDALKQYEVVIRVAPGEPSFQLALAKKYWGRGDEKKAMALVKKLEGRFSGDAGVLSTLADLYLAWGKSDLALSTFKRLTSLEPGETRHIENLGEQYFQRGEKAKAIAIWKRILRRKDPQSLAELARVYAEHDLLADSLVTYAKAIELAPKVADYRKRRANLLQRMRRYREALADWEKVLELSPDKASYQAQRREARRRIVRLLSQMGNIRFNRALRTWTREFRTEPPNLNSGYFLAEAYDQQGKSENRRRILEELLAYRPKNISLMDQLVESYRSLAQHDKAVALLLELAELDPQMEQSYLTRIAEIKTDLQEDAEAIEYVRKALAKSPNDPAAYEKLAEGYSAMQKPGKAIEAYEKVIELAPRRFGVYFTLARLHVNRGELSKASALYRKLLELARDEDILRRAGDQAVELEWLAGTIHELEEHLAPLVVANQHKPVYRSILVQLYDRYVPVLVQKLKSGDTDAAKSARKELDRIGRTGLRPLLDALNDEADLRQRQTAIALLGHLGNPSAAPPLLQVARSETQNSGRAPSLLAKLDWNLRIEALVAAGRLGNPALANQFAAMANGDERSLREAALFGLAMIANKSASSALIEASDDESRSVAFIACLGLSNVGSDKAMAKAIDVAEDHRRPDEVRAACAWSLGRARYAKARPTLERLVESGKEERQRLAAWALGQLGDSHSSAPLLRSYFSGPFELRPSVRDALSHLASPSPQRETPVLPFPVSRGRLDLAMALAVLTPSSPSASQPESGVDPCFLAQHTKSLSSAISASLGRHRDLVLRTLMDLDSRPEHLSVGTLMAEGASNEACMSILDELGPTLLPVLADLVHHRDRDIRKRSLSVMAKIGGETALENIKPALSDADSEVREASILALGRLGRAKASWSNSALEFVLSYLESSDWRERAAAAEALRGQSVEQVPALIKALRGDAKSFVRLRAAESLATHRGQPEVLEALITSTQSERESVSAVRLSAVRALQSSSNQKAQAALSKVARFDPSPVVRRAATQKN